MEPPKKINFWRVMTFFKNGRHFEPEKRILALAFFKITFLPFQDLILQVAIIVVFEGRI